MPEHNAPPSPSHPPTSHWRFGAYAASLAFFHLSEFLITAQYNSDSLSFDCALSSPTHTAHTANQDRQSSRLAHQCSRLAHQCSRLAHRAARPHPPDPLAFLVNHSWSYGLAALTSVAEYGLESHFLPSIKLNAVSYVGARGAAALGLCTSRRPAPSRSARPTAPPPLLLSQAWRSSSWATAFERWP